MSRLRPLLLVLLSLSWIYPGPKVSADEAADRLAIAVDALTKLEGVDLAKNPALQERVLKVLEKTRGTPGFVRLVKHFGLKGQEAGLLEVAMAQPKEENGIEAARLVLTGAQSDSLKISLEKNDAKAVALAEALGNTGHRSAVPFLLPLVNSSTASPELRRQAVLSLVKTSGGAKELLGLAKDGKLSPELNSLAVTELAQARWDDIRTEANHLKGQSVVALPPVAELLKMRGDPSNGQKVFQRASPGCNNCHVVRGQGTELGPNLSEIGSKLAKEALYQSILEPSAGISFGFEAFTLTLKDGDEAYGLIASETTDEVLLKSVGGVVTKHKKSNVVSRQKSTLSIMPAGLEAGMTVQELVDLVEYLSQLKKAE
jgi:putative heme-binding domain-containing protein